MKAKISTLLSQPFWFLPLAVFIKIPIFFTANIQEDSFITWRVARNLVEYGVIGFNGEERISASTTHLYLFVSALFRLIFSDYFIYPLLLFSGILFTLGSFLLAKIFFKDVLWKQGAFVLLLNALPPALTASFLGMEYGILFYLYCGFLYFGLWKQKRWAFFVFPVLLLWTRVDTVIFLGIFFLADLFQYRKINYRYILGGLVGLISVVAFNYLYFGEWVNHTIGAKKMAYKAILENNSLKLFLYQWAYYGGLLKMFSLVTFMLWLLFLGVLVFMTAKIYRDRNSNFGQFKFIFLGMVIFAMFKITAFAYLKAYFDWYYWLPRTFLFAAVLFYIFTYFNLRKPKVFIPLSVAVAGLYIFQLLQSYAIGYMERGQRFQIASDINEMRNRSVPGSILLEPAGIIPYYTGLYTYDEVGLVNKRVNVEMEKDGRLWWYHTVEKYHPDFIVTVGKKAGEKGSSYLFPENSPANFELQYSLAKTYPIARIHENAPLPLQWVYRLRPIGKDYYLYRLSKPH